ncbi:MAG: BamA/TamA family outer membrane protein [Candidatus Gastranaerophilales bacterium]|nr:BamA/TamA family outer membrane protein [Candidatus Gastranaerophilales bacterium]
MKKITRNSMIILALCLLTVLNTNLVCYSKDEEEKEPLIEAGKIDPKKLNTLQDRTYDEGITIKDIEISGNNLVKSDTILVKLSTKKGSKFDRELIQRDLKTIYDMGYFTERIKAVPQSSTTGIKLQIHVEENVPVTGFNILGNNVITTSEINNILKNQAGLPQNIAELNRSVEKIEELYAEKGYILSRIKKITDDPDGTINMQINEGIIDDIKITGNTKTKDFIIKRNMYTAPGMTYNENILKQDLTRIYTSQAFSDVRRVISASAKDPNKYSVSIEVDEKRTGSISLGGGVDTGSGLFGMVGYADNNFRGLGQQLSLNFLAGSAALLQDRDIIRRASLQIEANFVEPRFRNTLNSISSTAFARDYASYQIPLGIERRIGGEIEIARPIKKIPHLAGSVSAGFENVNIKEGNYDEIKNLYNTKGVDIKERAKQLSGGTFVSLGPSVVYDTRNNYINPTSGWYNTAGFKESFAISGDSSTFGKVTVSTRKYIPVGQKSTITLSGRLGSKVIGDMPEFAAFRLGGYNTIRGFYEGDVGTGTGFMMGSAELRTPIPFIDKVTKIGFFRDMRAAAFIDTGTIFNRSITDTLYNRPGYAISTGLGLRVVVPGMGPIRVDYGYPISYVGAGNKRGGRFTFGFGQDN